jgi:hypothetical protein
LPGRATNDDVARAAVYATNIMVAHGAGGELFKYILLANAPISTGAVPAWFDLAMHASLEQALVPIKQSLAFMNQCLTSMDQRVTLLERSVTRVSFLSYLV